MLEVIYFSVRPKNQDKKLHVFRVVFDSRHCEFSSVKESFLEKLSELFPFGFFVNEVSRHVADYYATSSLLHGNVSLVENSDHEYLAKYLNSGQDLD